jgi:hypothetical protein
MNKAEDVAIAAQGPFLRIVNTSLLCPIFDNEGKLPDSNVDGAVGGQK